MTAFQCTTTSGGVSARAEPGETESNATTARLRILGCISFLHSVGDGSRWDWGRRWSNRTPVLTGGQAVTVPQVAKRGSGLDLDRVHDRLILGARGLGRSGEVLDEDHDARAFHVDDPDVPLVRGTLGINTESLRVPDAIRLCVAAYGRV